MIATIDKLWGQMQDSYFIFKHLYRLHRKITNFTKRVLKIKTTKHHAICHKSRVCGPNSWTVLWIKSCNIGYENLREIQGHKRKNWDVLAILQYVLHVCVKTQGKGTAGVLALRKSPNRSIQGCGSFRKTLHSYRTQPAVRPQIYLFWNVLEAAARSYYIIFRVL